MKRVQPLAELPFVGGDVALDFVNTAEERGHPEAGDVLETPSDLRLWGQRRGLISRSSRLPADAPAELGVARDARELLYALFLARAQGRPLRERELARLAEYAVLAYRAARLGVGEDGSVDWHWSRSELSTIRHRAVTSAVALLHDGELRLKQCPGDHCGWFFLDRTKRGNRRWCSMSECGQDAKVERRRRRGHPAGSRA